MNDASREEFEAWWVKEYDVSINEIPLSELDRSWCVWQASRKQALADAAQFCESVGHHWSGSIAHAFFDTAEKIKELK